MGVDAAMLNEQLDALGHRFPLQRQRLSESIPELDSGRPVPWELLNDLRATREEFDALTRAISDLADATQTEIPEGPLSVQVLQSVLSAATTRQELRAESEQHQRAWLQALELVLAATAANAAAAAALSEVQRMVPELQQRVASAQDADVAALQDSLAPFIAFLDLLDVREGDDLDAIDRLDAIVREQFGAKLAVAMLKGAISLPATTQSSSESSVGHPIASISEVPGTQPAPPVATAAVVSTPPTSSSAIGRHPEGPSGRGTGSMLPAVPEAVATAARRAAQQDPAAHGECLVALIWTLWSIAGYGTAAFLAEHLVASHPETLTRWPALRLLRACHQLQQVLRETVTNGGLSDEQAQRLRDSAPESADSLDDEAYRFLLEALLISAAVLAHDPKTIRLLQQAAAVEPEPSLAVYLSQVASYLEKSASVPEWQDYLAKSRLLYSFRAVGEGLRTSEYPEPLPDITQKVWHQWCAPNGPIGAILTPMSRGDSGQVHIVRARADRLSSALESMVQETLRKQQWRKAKAPAELTDAIAALRKRTDGIVAIARSWETIASHHHSLSEEVSVNEMIGLREQLADDRLKTLVSLGRISREEASQAESACRWFLFWALSHAYIPSVDRNPPGLQEAFRSGQPLFDTELDNPSSRADDEETVSHLLHRLASRPAELRPTAEQLVSPATVQGPRDNVPQPIDEAEDGVHEVERHPVAETTGSATIVRDLQHREDVLPDEQGPTSSEDGRQVAATVQEPTEPSTESTVRGLQIDEDSWEGLLWRLVANQRDGLAAHLTTALAHPALRPRYLLPSWLLQSLALAPHLRQPDGEIAALLTTAMEQYNAGVFADANPEWNHGLRFLLAASAMHPALLAPNTGAALILRDLRLKEGLAGVYDYCQAVAAFSEKLQPLNPRALKGVRDQAAWEAEMQALLGQARPWFTQAPRMTLKYAGATKVWRRWLEADGVVSRLVLPVLESDTSRLSDVRNLAKRLSDPAEIDREVQDTDRRLNRRVTGPPIIGGALTQLRTHIRDALSLARRWIDLEESRPGRATAYVDEQARLLGTQLSRLAPAALQDLDQFEMDHPSLPARVGTARCRQAIQAVQLLFAPDQPFNVAEDDVEMILHSDLLRTPGLSVDERWTLRNQDTPEVVEAIRRVAEDGPPEWAEAFEFQCKARDHLATSRIVSLLERSEPRKPNEDELRTRGERALAECRDALRRDIAHTRGVVEGAVAFGLLSEEVRNGLAATVEQMEGELPHVRYFPAAHRQLEQVRQQVESTRDSEISRLRRQLASSQVEHSDVDYRRIEEVLARGDVLTATEYLEMARAGESIPEADGQRDPLQDFLERARDIEDYLEALPNAQDIARRVLRREGFCGIDLQRVPGAQTSQAAEMLEAWFTVRKSKGALEASLRRILHGLGFTPRQISPQRAHFSRQWVDVTTDPIRDKNQCPVPQYGSLADGHYRLLCVWDRPTEEDLLNAVGDTANGAPVLVLHFDRMNDQRRRALTRLCRSNHRTFVVIDQTLMVFLAGERGARLPVMFNCTLPFTYLEPYTTAAGLVPPEMFYGRIQERHSIINPFGACFIYGGRQLGKTALLRDVAREFHNPDDGHVAIWIDLKAHLLGYDRSIDGLWGILAGELRRFGVVPSSVGTQVTADRLLDAVFAWLDENAARRILLLLDEADRFLEVDGRSAKEARGERGEFARAAQLKGLMDRTSRRFKVVFAGLHNVQRTTRLVNHPLAHYGEPINIGPLLSHGEWREARALIERPAASLGHRYESPDLVTRILSQTNYYPSLIQLYCSHLLRYVANVWRGATDDRQVPPHKITSRHVDEAYRSQDLRKAIRDRFVWTLQLDRRYEVIAYVIAQGFQTEPGRSIDGFTVSWIREQALFWWEAGFRGDVAQDSFRTLLEEMVGLGVLRQVDNDRFTLRSPNVAVLMGTPEEVEAALFALATSEPPLEYEPATFRVAHPRDHAWRSPLTAQQESALKASADGVSILVGSDAAGLGDVEPFLRLAFGENLHILGLPSSLQAFSAALNEVTERRDWQGTAVAYIPPIAPWSRDWVEHVLDRMARWRSRTAFLRVVFAAGPRETWTLVNGASSPLPTLGQRGVSVVNLKPWHDSAVRQWLEEAGFGPQDAEGRSTVASVTGNWPGLLRAWRDEAGEGSHRWSDGLGALNTNLLTTDGARVWLRHMGLDISGPRAVLQMLASVPNASTQDLVELLDGVPAELVSNSLAWAELLSIVHPGGGTWVLDPIAARLLNAAT